MVFVVIMVDIATEWNLKMSEHILQFRFPLCRYSNRMEFKGGILIKIMKRTDK